MKHLIKAGKVSFVALACALAFALVGCSATSGAQSEEAKQAGENRQYMAQLNKQMSDLQQVMDDFQTAVSEQNTVAMKAQVEKAQGIAQAIDASEPTDSLSDAKDLYVDALNTLNGAMSDYADMYIQAENGTISGDDLKGRMEKVQEAYDEGVEKLKTADDAVAKLAQG